ncbi:MAG: hypothetical protein A2168_08110 [Planctomycetes bacterium RBG_13_50_24]|nr:MAG: hypothetical protein A2168_08110 [Planctomycetes bacterium RBG_13_50_24]
MENRTGTTFLIISAIAVCLSINPAVNGAYISFSRDAVIQDGDNYEGVYVYGNNTTVEIKGGNIGKLMSYDLSTVNVTGGHITNAQSFEQSTINISGGTVRVPNTSDAGSTINITGGTFWNIEAGSGELNMSGGQIAGLGIIAASGDGEVNITGYSFEYQPMPGQNDGRLTGFWPDGIPFSIDFRPGAYQLVTLHINSPGSAPIANAGRDQTIISAPGKITVVTLDGSASRDPDSYTLAYQWSWTVNASTYKEHGINPTIILPLGEHIIKLVVNDGRTDSQPDYVIIEVLTPAQQIKKLRDEKLLLLERIELTLEKEQQVISELDNRLDSGDYGDLTRDEITAAKQAVQAAILFEQESKVYLEQSTEHLKDAYKALDP